MKNKKLLYGVLVVAVLTIVGIGLFNYLNKPIIPIEPEEITLGNRTSIREDWQPMVEKIAVWQNGEEQIIEPASSEYNKMGRILITTLHKLDLQAKCVFSEEEIQEIKINDRVIEIIFKQADDFPISQKVEEEERYHIKTDEKGYRILENVKSVIFVLEDKRDEGLEAHVLVGSEFEGKIGYSCWAIKQEFSNELDKSWTNEIASTYHFQSSTPLA